MHHRSSNSSRRRRLSALAVAVTAVLAVPTATAAAAPHDTSAARSVASAASSVSSPAAGARAAADPSVLAAKRLNITMQAQQKTNWCWAAAGNTIATYLGKNYSQNQFCNAAFNRSQNTECPNNQATLGNVQNALGWMGINRGSYVTGWLRYDTVQAEVNANRPVETRIQWSNGGGHMHTIYGYDTANSWVYWGDPWPSSDRYNWASHSWYVNNNTFSWTHSLYRIGA
ncbi:papain-like cysteine protease family protein [Streptomyces sp. NRRL B-1347]|uniref:papain-like cysteine protease family protein n=1 Tax=Streptomyces sp. NRRL B-1347 TaxID=1476877 RepID=UPI0004C8F064|nr:papain-like cysteine protease family protein [Streptomyces sp. NRRL B-1347]